MILVEEKKLDKTNISRLFNEDFKNDLAFYKSFYIGGKKFFDDLEKCIKEVNLPLTKIRQLNGYNYVELTLDIPFTPSRKEEFMTIHNNYVTKINQFYKKINVKIKAEEWSNGQGNKISICYYK